MNRMRGARALTSAAMRRMRWMVWGVAAALLTDPRLLILDEPTNGLDPQGMARMRELIRELWTGEQVTHRGEHYTVENARIYTTPSGEIPIVISAFGPQALRLAPEPGDGRMTTGPAADMLAGYPAAGGPGKAYRAVTAGRGAGRGPGRGRGVRLPRRRRRTRGQRVTQGVVAVPTQVFYDDQEAGRRLVRFAFCKRTEVLAEAVTRLVGAG